MRWIVRLFSALIMLALLALGAVWLIPSEKVVQVAAAEFRKLTGRELTLAGAVRPTFWPHLGVKTGPVSIANAGWSDQGPMFEATALDLRLDMAALIGGTVRITGIEMSDPTLLLEVSAEGQTNWALDGQESAAGGGPATPFTLDRAVIDGGSVVWLDHSTGTRVEMSGIALETAIPDFAGPVGLTGSAVLNGQTITLDAKIATFAPFLDGVVVPVTLTATAGDSAVGFDGRLGTAPLAAEGRLDAGLSDLPAIFAALGQSAPDLPEGLGRRSIAVTGALTLTPEGAAYLRDGTVTLDGNRLSGAADLVPGPDRPRLTAQLAAGALDLSSLGGSGGGGGGPGWSTGLIDASGLGAIDAAITLSADSIDLGAVTLGTTRLAAALDAARAVVDLREVAAYGGVAAGQVIVNARSGLSARVDGTLSGVALQPLLTDLAGFDRLIGTGDLRLNVLASGDSLDAMMRSLAGDGRMALSNGELRGLDVVGMIRTLDPNFVGEGAKTIFDGITASFVLDRGVLANTDLAFAAPLMTATGAGYVDIGGQLIDYRVTPVSLGGSDLNTDVRVPLLITGPWSAPSFRLDLESLAEQKLKEEAKKLEEAAKAELARRAQEELGITLQPGEDLEQAARRAAAELLQQEAAKAQGDLQDQLQGEAGKALLDLLGGSN